MLSQQHCYVIVRYFPHEQNPVFFFPLSVIVDQVEYKKDAKSKLHYTPIADRPDIKKATQAAKLISDVSGCLNLFCNFYSTDFIIETISVEQSKEFFISTKIHTYIFSLLD